MTTKTDRELLELAARAVGLSLRWVGDASTVPYSPEESAERGGVDGYMWNPLTDDSDALRLATELSLNVFHTGGSCFALESDSDGPESSCSYRDCGGKHEATRRAIVRAAAVIGETP